jgi:ubiquinone biosynthesis protein Coq4
MIVARPDTVEAPKPGLGYVRQDSPQTLREGLAEYYARNPQLLDPARMPADAAALFRQHDIAHVVFGCDTTLRGETVVDTWTIFATSIGLRGYRDYLKLSQVSDLFAQTGYWRMATEFIRCIPDVLRVVWRSRQVTRKWPWRDYGDHLERPLRDIREQFNLRLV